MRKMHLVLAVAASLSLAACAGGDDTPSDTATIAPPAAAPAPSDTLRTDTTKADTTKADTTKRP